ncbi:MAG: putative aminohydrolase SsnA [Sphaerochaetaceae bacterium]|jgi:putative selenium metabolism protein SsnA|nr:putative aminohydrolase SsnA [Sphaerochaetaceae bacterium]
MDTLFKNVRIMQTRPPFEVQENMDVLVQGDKIARIGKDIESKGAKIVNGDGKTLMPGNVCSHHHYYSGLSRGMLINAGPQTDLIQILKEWWWRLDRGLDEEATYYSSLICSLDAIAAGTTSVVDHHASPNYIKGSLSTIAKGMDEVGLRGMTCYEVTDRNRGMAEVEEGVQENVDFATSGTTDMVKAMIGGHALFTIPDEGLKLMSDAVKQTGCGMHIHVAEGEYDQIFSHHKYNKDIVRRLDDFDLLSDNTLLVHGIFLNDDEIDLLNERGCFFAHNPRSNMNNQIGYSDKLPKVKKLIMGTDGCGGNMFEECKIAFFKNRDAKGPFWPNDFVAAMNRGNDLISTYFEGDYGQVKEGFKADLTLLDYHAPTPILPGNAAGHFVWGMSSNSVHSVMINGKMVMENREFPGIDVNKIYSEAAKVAERVWKKVDTLEAR